MSSNSSKYWMVGVAGAIGVIAILYFSTPAAKDAENPPENGEPSKQVAAKNDALPKGWANVGGIARPATDIVSSAQRREGESAIPNRVLHGFSPPVSPTANNQVELVYASLKSRENPNAFSSFAVAKPFDAEAYAINPDAYINEVEPSRVFNPAQPGDGVKAIRPDGSPYHRVVQGESVMLTVQAVPGAPVTLTSFQLGYFENELTSITVKADDQGFAKAKYTAGGGTIDDVQILAASPMTTGQVKFLVNVQLPR